MNDVDEIILRAKRGKKNKITSSTRLNNEGYLKQCQKPGAEAIVKVASFARGFRASKLIDYVTRSEKEEGKEPIEFEHDGEALKGEKEAKAVYDEWKEDFEKAKRGAQRKTRHVTHIVLSANCDNTDANAKRVYAAAQKLAENELGKRGHKYILVMHRDTKNPHVHVVVNNYNREKNGKKLRLNKPELFAMRTHFAENLKEMGIEQQATMRKDRPHIMEDIRKGKEQLSKRDSQYQAKMKQASPSVDAYAHRRYQSKAVMKLRKDVKRVTMPLSKERKRLIKQVDTLSLSLTKEGDPLTKNEVNAALSKLGNDVSGLQENIQAFKHPLKDERPQSAKERLRHGRALDQIGKQISTDISRAMDTAKKSNAPLIEKRRVIKALKSHEKQMKKALGKGLSR